MVFLELLGRVLAAVTNEDVLATWVILGLELVVIEEARTKLLTSKTCPSTITQACSLASPEKRTYIAIGFVLRDFGYRE